MDDSKQTTLVRADEPHQLAPSVVAPFEPYPGVLPNLFGKFHDYADFCTRSGCIPNKSETLCLFGKPLSFIWAYVQLGTINLVGAEHLRTPGRRLFVFNHSSVFDTVVVYRVMPLRLHARYMFAHNVMAGNNGWRQIVTGALGAFPVDRGNGKTVIPPAIDLLVEGKTVVLFPEGDISRDATPLPVKPGAVWIARGAYNRLRSGGELVSIIPGHIEYHKRHNKTAIAGDRTPFAGTGLRWRGGVTLTIHPPIFMHEVADLSDEAVMVLYQQAISTHGGPATQNRSRRIS